MRKTLHQHLGFWLSIRPALALTAVTAIATYLVVALWLRRYPECFPGAASIGDMVIGVSLSIIAAFIFYVIDVHVKEHRNRIRVNAYIAPLLHDILMIGLGFVHSLDEDRELNAKMGTHYKVTDIIKIMRKYDRVHKNSSLLVHGNYQQRMESIIDSINKVLVHYPNLDPDLIDILNGMLQSYMFQRIRMFDPAEELTSMADPVLEFLYRLRDLHDYTASHIPHYLEAPNHPDFAMYELYQQKRSELRELKRSRRKHKGRS